MAELKLITNEQEEMSESFLDWDDASIGKACKKMAWAFKHEMDFEDYRSIAGFGALLLLVTYAHESRADEMNLSMKNITLKDGKENIGDWKIKVKRKRNRLGVLVKTISRYFFWFRVR